MTAVAMAPDELEAALAFLTPAERAEFDALLTAGEPLSFRQFVSRVNPAFVWYRHAEQLADVLQRVADDELLRVMVFEPPRYGKSEQVSRLFPAYYLLRHPSRWAAIVSYAADLAYTLSRVARTNYLEAGGELRGDTTAVKHWETAEGGGLWATGIGGPATGKGAHLAVIDDPIKNAEEAASQLIRDKHWDWVRSVLWTRREPGAAVILTLTRWNMDDLAGRFMAAEAEAPERWHIVAFEAVKSDDPYPVPPTCTLEPDWRAPGEPLCPERFSAAELERTRVRVGPYFWAALYQQRPAPREGGMFPRGKALIVDALPADTRPTVRYWDKGGTEGGGDPTAGVRMSLHDGLVYVEHVARGQWGASRRNSEMRSVAETDGTGVRVWVEKEGGSGGKESAEDSVRLLAGFPVYADAVTGDKVNRADPLAAQWQAGNVRILRGPWNEAYLEEMAAFPNATHDDQVDASSGAYNKLAGRRALWVV